MPVLPLSSKLKKREHRSIALAQDLLVIEVYRELPKAVMHGGTAIWRCYGSSRFSEDVDFYLPFDTRTAKLQDLRQVFSSKNLAVEKFKKTNGSLFAKLSYTGTAVRLEAIFKDIKHSIIKPYEMSDGTSILVNTLSPEDLILEKISAYQARRKVRDLYDIYFLLSFLEDSKKVRNSLQEFLGKLERPTDERELKALVIAGTVPSTKALLEEIEKWAR